MFITVLEVSVRGAFALREQQRNPSFNTTASRQVILKPAESTPLTAFAMAELARRAGFPAGTLNMLTGDPAKISAPSTHTLTITLFLTPTLTKTLTRILTLTLTLTLTAHQTRH